MKQNHSDNIEINTSPSDELDYSGYAPLKLNYDEYREELKDSDMTVEQQNEFLETLWNIMKSFVELGWGLDSVPLINTENDDNARSDSVKMLPRKNHSKSFNQAVSTNTSKEQNHD